MGEDGFQQRGEGMDLGISEVGPLVNEGLFFGGSTQQHRGIWITTGDN